MHFCAPITLLFIVLFVFVSNGTHAFMNNTLKLILHDDTTLHLWIRPVEKGQVANAYLCPSTAAETEMESAEMALSAQQSVAECSTFTNKVWYDFLEIKDTTAGEYVLKLTDSTVPSLVYLFEEKTVLEEGIRILFICDDAKLPDFEGSYHLRAPFGWNSDPSGFSKSTDGLFHLFYQHFPHSAKWFPMHWGHAVSKDLINWIHLPIFMQPPNFLHMDYENGHFTGSAINLPNGEFGVFWTQRITDVPRGTVTDYPWREIQQYVTTKDFIRPDWKTHKTIIERFPAESPELGAGFRDPVVFLGPHGYYYMTFGAERKDGSAGVVLLYRANNKRADQLDRDWEYQGILHEDNRDELRMCECPMLVALGDPLDKHTKWVLSYVSDKGSYQVQGTDAEGRERMNALFVGHFDGKHFDPIKEIAEQKMDFVGGSVAYQGFYDPKSGRSFTIGWICGIGWIGDQTGDPDFDGIDGATSYTVPKEFVLSKNGKYLHVRPLPELAELRQKNQPPQQIRKGELIHLEKGQAELCFELSWNINEEEEKFELDLTPTHTNGKKMELRIDGNGIELKRTWTTTNKRLVVYDVKPTKIQIFIDLDTVEYFMDDGRWSGAVRLPNASQENRIGTVELKNAPTSLKSTSLWYLEHKLHKSAHLQQRTSMPKPVWGKSTDLKAFFGGKKGKQDK